MVNGSHSTWKLVTSGTESSHLGLVLLNILVSDLEEEMKCTLLRTVDETKLGSAASAFKGRTDVQRHLVRLEE